MVSKKDILTRSDYIRFSLWDKYRSIWNVHQTKHEFLHHIRTRMNRLVGGMK
jgi:hypothetical protein